MDFLKPIGLTSIILLLNTNLMGADLKVQVLKQSEWDSGFCSNVSVYNPNDTQERWQISFNAGGLINNLWNANYSQDSKTLQTTASGIGWNDYINSHSTVEFGYCANKVVASPEPPSSGDLSVTQTDNANWDGGFCKNVQVKNNTNHDIDWKVTFLVDGSVYNFWNANLSQNGTTKDVTASGVDWNNIVKANSQVEFGYCANTISSPTPTPTATPTSTATPTPTPTATPIPTVTPTPIPTTQLSYDITSYSKVLPLALKFYEAQRATGPFPTVTWRKAGGLSDGSDVGRDLTGGWFDAGDHVKFNLPMSYSATMLNWGMIAFSDAYKRVGTLDYGKDQVKYALDYFIQAYNEGANPDSASDDKVYYQVGDGGADHGFWGPPELMTMDRPTFTCDATNKCSEVAGGMAAAMASGSVLFEDNATYSALLLDKAKKIYRFAEEYQGNNGYTAANGYYRSYSGYNDELAWGAIWLYIATGDNSYLDKAKTYVASASDAKYWSQNWDNVSNGVNLLLSQITGESKYTNDIETNLNYWLNGITYTKGGLAFLNQWGSLRYSSTASFMALLYAQGLDNTQKRADYIAFAKGQIDYILGKNPRNSSYVVGYGINPPINPHHRASHNSQTNNIDLPVDNDFILEGALVGGPKSADDFDYADDRKDYVANEVATDYNAGFTGALAGLIALDSNSSNTSTPRKDTSPIFSKFNVGFGGSYAYPFTSNEAGKKIWVSSVDLVLNDNIENSDYYSNIKNFDASAFDTLQNSLKNSKFLVYWLVKGWQESWFDVEKIQQAMNAGYIPVFNYWWFGDKLMNGMPDSTKKEEYAKDNQKVANFLKKLNGTKFVIMEPEFNKENILSSESNQHEFASIISSAIDTIKSNTSNTLFSLAMMDTGSRSENKTYAKCGYDNCALGDKYEWGRPSIIYNDLMDKLDFISFQEMIGQFSRDPSNPGDWDNPNPISYSSADIGIDELSTRVANFSQFLKEKYNKPIFLPYIAIATATWNDTNSNNAIDNGEINYSGWEDKANKTYQELSDMKSELLNRGLFGFAPMALFDDPRHDYGGYQYFMQNEYHLGIIKSGAVDGVSIATDGDIVTKGDIVNSLFH